jgi:hypothetical protein
VAGIPILERAADLLVNKFFLSRVSGTKLRLAAVDVLQGTAPMRTSPLQSPSTMGTWSLQCDLIGYLETALKFSLIAAAMAAAR